MKKIFPLRIFVVLFSASLAFTGALCPEDPTGPEEKECGVEIDWFKTLDADAYIKYSVEGSNAVFQYEDFDIPRDICVNSHLSVAYTIFTYVQRLPATWTVKGVSYWANNNKRELPIYSTDPLINRYRGGEDFSIKEAFGVNGKGSLALQVLISFPSTGSLASDKETLLKNIFSVTLQCSYLEYEE